MKIDYTNWLTQNSIRVIPKKKIRLRRWFKYFIGFITMILFIIIISDAVSIKTAILKTIICLPIFCINCYVLSVYGGLNE